MCNDVPEVLCLLSGMGVIRIGTENEGHECLRESD